MAWGSLSKRRDIWETMETLAGGSNTTPVKFNCTGSLWGMLQIKDFMIEFEVPH